MEIIENPKLESWKTLLKRPTQDYAALEHDVKAIFQDIKNHGDTAVSKYTELFDGLKLDKTKVDNTKIKASAQAISPKLKSAIDKAYDNVYKFHKAQQQASIKVETQPGVTCWQASKPIQKVGLYIPGGTAPLFSSILMLGIPAQISGCNEVVITTPPQKSGQVHPAMLYAAYKCGIHKIFQVGGIQAIAAMTFGTESIPKVYKIFGPGNQYVTVAKQVATSYDVSIDMPAGPSELLVLADDTANPNYVASDLLSQAEHGADSQVILVTTSKDFALATQKALQNQLDELPRKAIATEAIKHSKSIVVSDTETAIEMTNFYSPEHLIICVNNEDKVVEQIHNAGSVFIGNFTPESAGDYASGTNHTLPTNAFARQYSGVNLDAFHKKITYQKITKEGLKNLGPHIETMAETEELQAHKNAVSLRLKDLE
ncbi:histidinol dehydrogenase [Mesohalobacter halotolerans]|uniref:Histidinol dehydrogenase n=1 Tax=Mesohalobacter halotolerans TaxID=1883405 RepID=A0A4U5TQE6_9FLAO|nr:histidinol dehydrogenase [Mesohalobacter halotolerans]MBS3739180.1 histidinol dehydrogenase [Psychroflexus sp.]TKS56263.1 histidinol dehydrogenase [Mesohalobacter halotolerans]